MTSNPPEHKSPAAPIVLSLLLLAWALGTPVLAYGGMISGASFFGEAPSPQEMETAERLLAGAVACAYLAPLIGLVIAVRAHIRALVWIFAGALTVSIGAPVLLIAS